MLGGSIVSQLRVLATTMGARQSASLVEFCKEGNVAAAKAMIKANKTEFDAQTFVKEVFETAREAIEEHTYIKEGKRVWIDTHLFPAAEPEVISAIELVLRAHADIFDSETVGKILTYACCTHVALVPVVTELFKPKLALKHIIESIMICESRCLETCWLIMKECMDQLTGDSVNDCFNICCKHNNGPMLKLLLDCHHAKIQETVRIGRGGNLTIDEGIANSCGHADPAIIELLIAECRYIGPRLLWGCAVHKNIGAADLVFTQCKRFLTGKSGDQFQVMERPIVNEAFIKAASNDDTTMLELFINELGANLPYEARRDAFLAACHLNHIPSMKMLLKHYPKDLRFKYGYQSDSTSRPNEETWALLVETFKDRLQRMDNGFWALTAL